MVRSRMNKKSRVAGKPEWAVMNGMSPYRTPGPWVRGR